MSAKVHNYYMNHKDKSIYLLLLRTLAWDADHEGVSTMSIPELANKCTRSDRAIQLALKALQENGKVGIKYQDGHQTKDGKTNRYFLNDFRVSIKLEPVITKSPYQSKSYSKPSPRAVSNTQAVKFSMSGGEDSFTLTNTSKQNILNTTTVSLNHALSKDKESALQMYDERPTDKMESAMHDQRPTDQSARDIEFKNPQPSENTVQPSTDCSSEKKEFLNEKTHLIFPSDLTNQEDQTTALNMFVQNNIPNQQWQLILDEFEGKTLWKHKRGEQIPSKMGYLYGMVKKAAQGTFNPESAKWVAKARQQEVDKKKSLEQKANEFAQRGNSTSKAEIITKLSKEAKLFISEMNQTSSQVELQKCYFKINNSKIPSADKDYIAKLYSKRSMEIRA